MRERISESTDQKWMRFRLINGFLVIPALLLMGALVIQTTHEESAKNPQPAIEPTQYHPTSQPTLVPITLNRIPPELRYVIPNR